MNAIVNDPRSIEEIDRNRKNIIELLNSESTLKEMKRVLNVSYDRFARTVITLLNKNPDLHGCTPTSFLSAVMSCAQFQLSPDPIMGDAWFMPFNNYDKKTGTQTLQCQLQLGYKGWRTLAARSGFITMGYYAYENDIFEPVLGMEPHLKHIPNLDNPGAIKYYYATAQSKKFPPVFDYMTIPELDDIREACKPRKWVKGSKTPEILEFGANSPWVKHLDAMRLTKVVKKLLKKLPIDTEVMAALEMDSLAEQGKLDESFNINSFEDQDSLDLPEPIIIDENAELFDKIK